MRALLLGRVTQPVEAEDGHGLVTSVARQLCVLPQRRDGGLTLVEVEAVAPPVPGKGLLESTVVAEDTHLEVGLKEAELAALFDLAYLLLDGTHEDLLGLVVLVALLAAELEWDHPFFEGREVEDFFGATEAQGFHEGYKALFDLF